jgi:pantoate--beta-alanine ligase
MGYLHAGHVSLVTRACAENDDVVASIFVNPLQFAAGEDLSTYPRDPEGDAAQLEQAGVRWLFTPDVTEMYPSPMLTTVTVAGVTAGMEGAARPTHFAGVATVVAKLFGIVGPCRAYFGEKDYQQLALITALAADLSMPVEVVGCPTSREPDGLARSSRNVYLDPAQRAAAPVLQRALQAGAALIREGETDAAAVRSAMAAVVATEPAGELEYVTVADSVTLEEVERADPSNRLLGAVRFGSTRLIDNIAVADGGDPT